MTALKQCVEAGHRWKELYAVTSKAISLHCPRPWDFDIGSIFAHIDAFLQRCADLLEVCQAQLQFAPTQPMPVFGGTKGPEIHKSIVDIQVRRGEGVGEGRSDSTRASTMAGAPMTKVLLLLS